jgi:phage/plasmid-associated DNA primase
MDFYKRLGVDSPKKTKKYVTNVNDIDIKVIDKILRDYSDVCNQETKTKLLKLKNIIKSQGGKLHFSSGKSGSGIKEYGRKGQSSPLPMLWKKVKNTLLGHIWTDIDIVNCQPTILKNICEKLEYPHPNLQKLCNNRDDILKQTIEEFDIQDTVDYDKKSVAKMLYNSIVFGSSMDMWINGDMKKNINNHHINQDLYNFIIDFKKEIVTISKKIYEENEFIQDFYERQNLKIEKDNKYGSSLSKVLQIEEDRILDIMIKFCEDKCLDIKCLEFDGLRIKNTDNLNLQLLNELEQFILQKTGYKIKVIIKDGDFKLFDVLTENQLQEDKRNGYEDYLNDKYKELFNDEEKEFNMDCLTEYGLMETLLKIDDNFIWSKNQLYYFNGIYWKLDETDNKTTLRNSITHNLKPFIKDILNVFIEYKKFMDDENIKLCDIDYKTIEKKYYGLTDDKKERPLIIQSQKIKYDDNIEWNSKTYLLQFDNVLYDTKTGEFIKPKKEYYINHSIGYEWNNEKVDENKKQEFINLVKSCLYENVWEWFLCYCGSMIRKENSEEICVISTGVGGNGKSLLLDILQSSLGDSLGKIPSSFFTEKDRKTGGANSTIIGLKNSNTGITDEIEVKTKFQLERFKTITSNGNISARGLYDKKEVNFKIGRVMIFCNQFPEFERFDEGIIRRIFNVVFPYLFRNKDKYDNKNPLHRLADYSLKNKFLGDESYKMSVMSVLMDFCKRYDELVKLNGFTPPDEIRNNTKDTIEENCSVRRFNTDFIVKTDSNDNYLSLKELYDRYTLTTDELKPDGKKEFNVKFQSLGYPYKSKYSGIRNMYFGLRFKKNEELEKEEVTVEEKTNLQKLQQNDELDYETEHELEYPY